MDRGQEGSPGLKVLAMTPRLTLRLTLRVLCVGQSRVCGQSPALGQVTDQRVGQLTGQLTGLSRLAADMIQASGANLVHLK